MKAAETKNTARQQSHKTDSSHEQPFFEQEREQAFFSAQSANLDAHAAPPAPNSVQPKAISETTPFFTPSAIAPVQRECADCETEEASQANKDLGAESPPIIQRMPAFESELGIQTKSRSNVAVLPSSAITTQTQPSADTGEFAPQGDETTDIPQIQMMPAFSSADDSGEAEDSNHALSPLQFRLVIGQPGDPYEREADAMADQVAARSKNRAAIATTPPTHSPPQRVSRQPESLMMLSEPSVDWVAAMKKGALGTKAKPLMPAPLQRMSRQSKSLMMQSNGKPSGAQPQLESRLHQAKGRGTSLDADTQTEMEEAFSSDFSSVQVHSGQEAASLNQSLGARAFTHGNDIFFNRGEYQPQSPQGKHLLAHELTHTIQQGHGVQRKGVDSPPVQAQTTSNLQRVPDAPGLQPTTSSEVVDISSGFFKPSEKVKGEIEALGNKGLNVRTKIQGVTSEGLVKVKLDRQGNYGSINKGSMPLLNDWTKQLGGMYVNFKVENNQIAKGYASLTERGRNTNDWLKALKQNSAVLGGLGLKVGNLPTPVNKLENGKLTLGVSDLRVEVGGFVDAQFNLSLENTSKPKIDGTADINVKGIARGTLKLDNTQEKLTGEVELGVNLKDFSGEAKVTYKGDGTVDIGGKAAYNANKLSGEIQFVATDLETANRFGRDAIAAAGGKENVQDAPPPAPVPVAKENSKQRALAATGQLGFNLTTWFAGTVNVVVDGNGNITVIGRIAPPAEVELFKQRDWEKEIVTLEARAYYGIPVVGNLNVFANIGLYAIAKLGPAKLYDIEILGTYSTEPEIQRSIQISGSLNISAYAGLRLRAEGGAGVELIDHDLRFGVGLNADVGVKAYADARPTIGYRDPGVFFISGTLDLVAQPMLGLGGDFFVELDSPYWSPAPDKKWVWPLFSKEWPLGDPLGISATLKDYELGSGKVPEVELKKPEFDPSKFMTNMVDNKLPEKSGGKSEGQGTFKEDGSVPQPDVASKKPEPNQPGESPSKKGTPPPLGKSANPDPAAEKSEDSMKLLADAARQTTALKAKAPFAQADLTKELNKIEDQIRGIDFSFRAKDDTWAVTPRAGGKSGNPFELGAKDAKGLDKKTDDKEKITNVPEQSSILTLPDGESHTVYMRVSSNRLFVEMASYSKAQIDLVLSRLAQVCRKAKNDYGEALKNNPTRKEAIDETIYQLDRVIQSARKTYRGKDSVYEEIDNILTRLYPPYDRMTKPQASDAAEEYLRSIVAKESARLSRSIKVGFKTLEGLRFKSGYVDEGGILLPKYNNVRRSFYNVKWSSSALTYKTNELKRLNSEALKQNPSLVTSPDKDNFYLSEDVTGVSTMPSYVADKRKSGDEPELDHKDPLANRWLKTGTPKPGNNTNQADRDADYSLITNLQVLSGKMNRNRSGPPFSRQVEPGFRGPLDPP